MSQYRATDILFELIELSHERIDEVRCQVAYYRASAYKRETAAIIDAKLAHLERVSGLFGDEMLCESFADFAAVHESSGQNCAPGECLYTQRIGMLLHAIDAHLARLYRALVTHTWSADVGELVDAVRTHRQDLLALCSEGSRHWTFFKSIE